MSQSEGTYQKPLVHQQPKYCDGTDCAHAKQCIRFRTTGRGRFWVGSINVRLCKTNGFCYELTEGTFEGQEFRRQEKLYSAEMRPFSLRKDYTIPTNTSMYECFFCKGAGIEHKIEDVTTPAEMRKNWDSLEKLWPSTIHVCSGCGRYDGPYVPYGDDD